MALSQNLDNCKNRLSDKFKSVNIIKDICLTETDKLADEISWTSSEGKSCQLKNNKSKLRFNKINKKCISSEEKVKSWLLKSEFNSKTNNNELLSKKNKADYKCGQSETKLRFDTLSKTEHNTEACENVNVECDSTDSCPKSPILISSQIQLINIARKEKLHHTPIKMHNCENDILSPVLNTRTKTIKLKEKSKNKLTNGKSNMADVEENSPILERFFKKRKLDEEMKYVPSKITADTTKKSFTQVKKILFPQNIKAEQLSQVSIHFSNTPSDNNCNNVLTQSSHKSVLIESLSETQKNLSDSSLKIVSHLSSPIRTCSSENLKSKLLTVTFDKTKQLDLLESPVKKNKKKLPLNSVGGRLQKLIKKHKSSLSLWHHEHYLAANSNFQLPAAKDDCLVFRINDLEEDCGRFLVRCSSLNNEDDYTIVINNSFVKKLTLSVNSVICVYKPYSLIKMKRDCVGSLEENVIINVCRVEIR